MRTEGDASIQVLPEVARALSGKRKRLQTVALYLLTAFLLITLNFFLPRAMPGDPITAMLASGSGAGGSGVTDEATRKALRRYYGLDRPVADQYIQYLKQLATADLGTSIRYNQPVSSLIAARLPWTLLLGVSALAIAVATAHAAGVQAGWRRGGVLDRSLLGFFTAVANFPAFFVASMAPYVFAVKVRWVPLAGGTTPFAEFGPLRTVIDVAHHLILPACILGLQLAAGQFLVMRAGMVGELGSDYLLMGRAKGLGERWLKYRYAARNALLPSISLTALMLSFAVAGTIFVERVFAYPGLGRLTFEAAAFRDYPLMQGDLPGAVFVDPDIEPAADLVMYRLDPRTTG